LIYEERMRNPNCFTNCCAAGADESTQLIRIQGRDLKSLQTQLLISSFSQASRYSESIYFSFEDYGARITQIYPNLEGAIGNLLQIAQIFVSWNSLEKENWFKQQFSFLRQWSLWAAGFICNHFRYTLSKWNLIPRAIEMDGEQISRWFWCNPWKAFPSRMIPEQIGITMFWKQFLCKGPHSSIQNLEKRIILPLLAIHVILHMTIGCCD